MAQRARELLLDGSDMNITSAIRHIDPIEVFVRVLRVCG